jgi:cardiolipin synthase
MNSWVSEELFFKNDAFYTNLLAAIDSAKKTIDVATYILNDDAVGQRFYQALIGAAQRGVQVRMVVDGFGSSRWVGLHSKSTIQWMNWRVFHPLKGQWPLNLNRRTHCKLAICDDQKAWVGSQNLTAEHSELASGKAAWRDTGAAVTGADVSLLKLAFEVLWLRSTPQTSRKKWRERLQLLRLKPHSTRHAIRSVRFNASLSLRRRMNLTLAKNIVKKRN